MDGGFYGPEAHRWLSIAERLLAARDFHSARTFAIRARESDPRFDIAEHMLAVIDTLIAGGTLAVNNLPNYYSILQLAGWTQDLDLVSAQYGKLVALLDPSVCKFVYASEALRLVNEAWGVLSSSERKMVYDSQLGFSSGPAGSSSYPLEWQQLPRQQQLQELFEPSRTSYAAERESSTPIRPSYGEDRQRRQENSTPSRSPTQPSHAQETRQKPGPSQPSFAQQMQNDESQSANNNQGNDEAEAVEDEERLNSNVDADFDGPTFWTKCPFCFCLYEYPKKYEECTLRCQYCRRAFEAVLIETPTMKDGKFCCWGYFPLGCPENVKKLGGFSGWSPISPMFACPFQGDGQPVIGQVGSGKGPRFIFNDDDVFVEVSDLSDGPNDDDHDYGSIQGKSAKTAKGESPAKVRNTHVERGKKVDQGNVHSVQNLDGGSNVRVPNSLRVDSSRIGVASSGKKQAGKGAKDWGRLDLNLEFSNEVEEPVAQVGEGRVAGNGADPNIEGTGFFEGLDEFLDSLPILR